MTNGNHRNGNRPQAQAAFDTVDPGWNIVTDEPAWADAFFEALLSGDTVVQAADKAGVSCKRLYHLNQHSPQFAKRWDDIRVALRDNIADKAEDLLRNGIPDAKTALLVLEKLRPNVWGKAVANTPQDKDNEGRPPPNLPPPPQSVYDGASQQVDKLRRGDPL